MEPEATDKIRPHLEDHEELLWSGRPVQGLFIPKGTLKYNFSMSAGGLVAFGAVWMMWVHPATGTILRLFSMVPALIGCYFLVGRLYFNIWARAHTWYGLTNRRAIVVTDFAYETVDSEELYHRDQLEYVDGPDERGTVKFGGGPSSSLAHGDHLATDQAGQAWDAGTPHARKMMQTQFRHIDDAYDIYELARDQVTE